jgi:O-antigen/teichoic acid export membrane protein
MALNVTMCLVVVLSPLQDFLRRMLHLSGRSWHAARVSLIHLGVVALGGAVVTLGLVPLSAPWIPLGLLALANAVSLTGGMALSGSKLSGAASSSPEGRANPLPSGGWLLVIGLFPNVAAVLVSLALVHMRGPELLGYFEAARIVAQPIPTLALGLGAVLGPRAMRAAHSRRRTEARRIAAQFRTCLGAVGMLYLLAVGIPHRGNVFARLVPEAFTIPGVVAFLIVAYVAMCMALPSQNELLGAGRFRFLAATEAVANAARVACVFLVGFIGIFALPVGILAHALLRLGILRIGKRRIYARPLLSEPGVSLSRSTHVIERRLDTA